MKTWHCGFTVGLQVCFVKKQMDLEMTWTEDWKHTLLNVYNTLVHFIHSYFFLEVKILMILYPPNNIQWLFVVIVKSVKLYETVSKMWINWA